MMADPMLIGPMGRLIAVRSPETMQAKQSREGSTLTIVDGRTVAYRAPRSARSWTWPIPWSWDDEIDDLIALEQGAYGPGPWRWYDPMAAEINMLPDVIASPGVGSAPWRWFAATEEHVTVAGPVEIDGGRTVPVSISPAAVLEFPRRFGSVDPIPVLPGRDYVAAGYLVDGDGTLSLVWTDADGVELSRVDSPRGSGRLTVTGPAPAEAAGVHEVLEVGEPGQVLATHVGGYATTPDDPALDITGDLDIRVHAALDSWQTGSVQALVAKYLSTGDQRSYEFSVRATGQLALTWSTNGTGSSQYFRRAESTAPVPAAPGDEMHVRVTMDVANDAGVWEVSFLISPDGTDWLPLGTPVTGVEATSIHAGTAPVTVGVTGVLTLPAAGQFHTVEIRNGIDGTVVANPDWTLTGPWVDGDDSSTPARADGAGRSWTLAGPAEIEYAVTPTLGSRVAGLQLTEGTVPGPWRAGMGMPWVQIVGLDDYAYRRLIPGERDRDVTVTLLEVP